MDEPITFHRLQLICAVVFTTGVLIGAVAAALVAKTARGYKAVAAAIWVLLVLGVLCFITGCGTTKPAESLVPLHQLGDELKSIQASHDTIRGILTPFAK